MIKTRIYIAVVGLALSFAGGLSFASFTSSRIDLARYPQLEASIERMFSAALPLTTARDFEPLPDELVGLLPGKRVEMMPPQALLVRRPLRSPIWLACTFTKPPETWAFITVAHEDERRLEPFIIDASLKGRDHFLKMCQGETA